MKHNGKNKFVKIERIVGELLVVTGILIIFLYELYLFILFVLSDGFHFDTSILSVFLIVLGFAILFVSVFREQIFQSKKQRYKDVEK